MKKLVLILAGSVVLGGASLAKAADESANAQRIVLPATVIPTHYDLDVTLDAGSKGFSGKERIDVTVAKATRRIVLNAAELQFQGFGLDGAGAKAASMRGSVNDIVLDNERQTATFNFPKPVPPGHHVLTIEYTGKINDNYAGLFALTYDTPQGRKRALYTQFENSDARRFLPCWDEPARKATFTLAVMLPATDMAVSNMPIANSESLPDGLKHVHFATTPKMSSYLLFLGAGDFERIARRVHGVDVGIIVKRGDLPKAAYALDAASQVLPYLEDYFGLAYPLPKLDLVAGPGRSQFFSAMENWGAIFYNESALEVDPALSTESDRQTVYMDVAHEMAHQWFGDLVTMQWWDEIWLNEGFASWMEGKVTDHFRPEWQIPLRATRYKEQAMVVDARQGTHPVVQPIRDVLQANEAFDSITYAKGFAVINMLESFVGEEAFRAGVRQYIRKHAYGNTVSDDLWAELDKTAAQPVSATARDFTLQPGVPLISVLDKEETIELQQGRFAVDSSGDEPFVWHVPVFARSVDGSSSWRGLVAGGQPVTIGRTSGGVMIVNASQTGYFRTLYQPALLQGLVSQFDALTALDQSGLVNDTHALGLAGREPLSDFLEVARRVKPDTNPAILTLVTDYLRELDSRFDGLEGQAAFRDYVRHILSPVFANVGWIARDGDSADTKLLRASLLGSLGQMGDPAVLSEARSRFAKLRGSSALLAADLRQSILSVVAENADASTWDQLHDMARHAASYAEAERLYGLLGTTRDPQLAQRALELTLTDELAVTLRPQVIKELADFHFADGAFDFVASHFEQVNQWLEPDSRSQFAPNLLLRSQNAAMIPRLRVYSEAHIPSSARREARAAEAAIAYNVRVRSQQLPEIDQWLKTIH